MAADVAEDSGRVETRDDLTVRRDHVVDSDAQKGLVLPGEAQLSVLSDRTRAHGEHIGLARTFQARDRTPDGPGDPARHRGGQQALLQLPGLAFHALAAFVEVSPERFHVFPDAGGVEILATGSGGDHETVGHAAPEAA